MLTSKRRVDTKELILDACDRIMAHYGFRKMSMDDLAVEAGVSKRTIYLYFSSKEEVGLSSVGRVVENVRAELEQIVAEDGSPEERLRRMLIRRVMGRVLAVQQYHHGLDQLFEVIRTPYMERRRAAYDAEKELISQVLQEGRKYGAFYFEDVNETSNTLLLATNAFVPYSLSVRELGQPEMILQRLTAMVDLLLRGLQVCEQNHE